MIGNHGAMHFESQIKRKWFHLTCKKSVENPQMKITRKATGFWELQKLNYIGKVVLTAAKMPMLLDKGNRAWRSRRERRIAAVFRS